jgi:hypothetical protein
MASNFIAHPPCRVNNYAPKCTQIFATRAAAEQQKRASTPLRPFHRNQTKETPAKNASRFSALQIRIELMARGWESKAVEGQVQEFQSKEDRQNKKQVSQDQIETRRKRGVLLLSRARVEKQLQASQGPRYREQLERALADLDAQLAQLPTDAK